MLIIAPDVVPLRLMKFTPEQYEKLKQAIVDYVITGVKSVQYGDKTVTYLSLAEMKDALRMMEDELYPERYGRKRKVTAISRGFYT